MPVPITPTGTANNHFRSDYLMGRPGHHRIVFTNNCLSTFAKIGVTQIDLVVAFLSFPDEKFHEDFDPYGDRDFISMEVRGIKVWGKIDHYQWIPEENRASDYLSEDTADDKITCRTMTILLPEDY